MNNNFNNKNFSYEEYVEDYDVFYNNKDLENLVSELREKDTEFSVSKQNICSFSAECMEFEITYEVFLKKFAEISEGDLVFTEIQLDEFSDFEYIEIDFFDFDVDEKEIEVDFKINDQLVCISVEFRYDWFNEQFVYELNKNLKSLGYEKSFYFSNEGEVCNIIYANQKDIEKINKSMSKNIKFNTYNIFSNVEI